MSSGKTHLRIWRKNFKNAIVWSILVGLVAFYFKPPVWFLYAPISYLGFLLGRYVTPDLDLIGITSDEGRMMRELSILGVLIVMLFFPYAYLMRFVGIKRKGHRNFFSHFPFISTIIRLGWLVSFPVLSLLYYEVLDLYTMLYYLAPVLLGLTFADLLHYLADIKFRIRILHLWRL